MATYAELTIDQQADLAAYDKFLRGVFSSLAALARASDADNWNEFASTRVDPVLTQLDGTELIPNSTDFARAEDLTVEEFQQVQAVARQLTALLVAKRALLVKTVGVNT